MKRRHQNDLAIAAASMWWLSNIILPARAVHYGCSAERDERSGFPNTAAMEWRSAAELLPANSRAAEYCWRRWERVMHLPRRLAGPFDRSRTTASGKTTNSGTRQIPDRPAGDQISLSTAA